MISPDDEQNRKKIDFSTGNNGNEKINENQNNKDISDNNNYINYGRQFVICHRR